MSKGKRVSKKDPGRVAVSKNPPVSPAESAAIRPARRTFLNRLWMLLAGVGLVELGVVLIRFFRPPKPHADPAKIKAMIAAGRVTDFQPGSVTAFPQGRFYLVRLEDGGFLALSRQCTHLGCTVPWDDERKQFACPCHASVFDITGSVVNAPAPRPLDCFQVVIENNVIHVDAGQRFRRNQFRADQVIYAQTETE